MYKALVPLSACLTLFSVSALADSSNPTLNDNLSVRAGGFFTSIDTNVAINGKNFNFEDVLDDNVSTGTIQGLWRITNKIRLTAGYWAVDRDEATSLGSADNIGGTVIPAGSTLSASFDTSYLNAAIGYSFIRSDDTEIGVDLGLASLGLTSGLRATVGGVGDISLTAFDESYLLPTIGVYFTQALSPKWSIAARLGGIGLDLGDDFKGSVIEANASIEFRPWQNVGMGLAYMYNSAEATLNNLDAVDGLDVDWKYQGPFAFLTLGFGG